MLHGRRLDHALEHVNGSRYALVHAVAKRARQITLWLTADPAELRAEAAPPPMAGESISRDPVALSEAEILDGEVIVRWDPDGQVDEREFLMMTPLETDPLLLEGLEGDEDDDSVDVDDEAETLTPALVQALDVEAPATEEETAESDAAESTDDELDTEDIAEADPDAIEEISLDEVDEGDEGDEDEPES